MRIMILRLGRADNRAGRVQPVACLRGCGLVEAMPDGRRTWYRLADPHLAPALDELLRVTLFVEPGCCAGDACTCA